MTRQLLSFCLALALLAVWPANDAGAVELPVRKAGLWEMKVLHDRLAGARHDDAAVHRRDHRQGDEHLVLADGQGHLLETGYPEDRDRLCHRFRLRHRRHVDQVACRDHRRLQLRLHREVDLAQRPAARPACRAIPPPRSRRSGWAPARPDQKPGDIMMPGGMKMNIKDMEKLKGLMPKQPPK